MLGGAAPPAHHRGRARDVGAGRGDQRGVGAGLDNK